MVMVDGQEKERVPFLGVTSSVRDFIWTDRLKGASHMATAISQRHDLPEILGRVLAARDVDLDDVEVFLDPSLKALMPDPNCMQDMDKASERIADAIVRGEKITIFGDYDVDGASSSALLHRLFAAHGLDARIYIPDRIFEGYGPNKDAIETLIDEGARLIITVDCGSTSHEALGVAKERGIDVVVIDHHQADAILPDVHSVVNPNRQDDLSGLGHLAAAGVVFMTMVAVVRALRVRDYYKDGKRPPDMLEWLDIVALATVCDVVPLKGLNRAFVTKGLQVMRYRKNIGLRLLSDVSGLKSAPNPYHLGFLLGPRINAGGRIGDAALGSKLLSLDDEIEAERIAQLLDKLNKERKEMETRTLEEALAQAEFALDGDPDLPMLITGADDWHKGLVGLVASRLTDKFRRPSLVISWTDTGEGTGSARSIGGVDLGAVVREAVSKGLLIKGGGHAMAAGLTVTRDNFEALKAFMMEKLQKSVTEARDKAALEIDGSMTPRSANVDLMDLLDKAGPYGQNNPTPRFAFPAHRVSFSKIIGENHVKCSLMAADGSKIDAIAFRSVGTPMGDLLLDKQKPSIHVAGQLTRNDWGGREKIELIIDDVARAR